jgi:DNA-directed RNA polymerase I subunit RPA2
MLLMPRANFPMAIIRPSYKSRGKLYTPHAVLMRSLRPDNSTQTNTVHYCRDGSVFLRFSHSKEEWLIPFVLAAKCVHNVSDGLLLELLAGAAASAGSSVYLQERAFVLLQQQSANQPIANQSHARNLLGATFRATVGSMAARSWSDEQVGEMIAKRFFLVHTEDSWEKLMILCVMYQKLIALVREEIVPDNQDAFSSHELLLPGQIYGIVLKEGLEVMMMKARATIGKLTRKDEAGRRKHKVQAFRDDQVLLKKVLGGCSDVGKRLDSFISTGNVSSRSGCDLMQVSGYTIVADKFNQACFSYIFVAFHRGQYFT